MSLTLGCLAALGFEKVWLSGGGVACVVDKI